MHGLCRLFAWLLMHVHYAAFAMCWLAHQGTSSGGGVCVLQDDQLSYNRMDFLKLPSHQGAIDLMQKGYQYAGRIAATGEYDRKFASVKR